MAKVCVNCDKKIGAFSMMSLELPLGQQLCNECAEVIQDDISELSRAKTIEDFNNLRDIILKKSNENYSEAVCAYIKELTYNILKASTYIDSSEISFEETLDGKKLRNNFMITTGYDFAGHSIKKYLGVDNGQVVLGTGFLSEFSASFSDFIGVQSDAFETKLQQAQDAAIDKLVIKSHLKGANALIGISFDYITFHGNMIGVVANGTSVVVEKDSLL